MIKRQSIRYKINLTITVTLLVVTLVFATVLAIYETQRRNVFVEQVKGSLYDLTSQYSTQLGNEIFSNQLMAIQATMDEVMKRDNMLLITTYNENGKILCSTDNNITKPLSAIQLSTLSSKKIFKLQEWNGKFFINFTSPIVAYGERVGYWRIHYSMETMRKQTLNIISIFIALILSLSILIIIFLNSILVRLILNPIHRLQNTMQNIQEKESKNNGSSIREYKLDKMVEAFDQLPDDLVLSRTTNNEINSLAFSFQQMLFSLKNAYIDIRTDSLTGLYNRIKIDEALEREVNSAQRYQHTFSIIMLDIDYFKKINDTYGHLAGDKVLKIMAHLLNSTFRKTDVIGRWGGEEFLILLPQQNKHQACIIAEKLREKIATYQFPYPERITASLGITEYATKDIANDLIKRADKALYNAKERGRNRIGNN